MSEWRCLTRPKGASHLTVRFDEHYCASNIKTIRLACLVFFGIQPRRGETIATDGKVLRGSYERGSDALEVDSDPAIMLVSAYIVERGLILDPYEVDCKTNEITALPAFIKQMALHRRSVCF